MNVQQLIEELQKVQDKSLPVEFYYTRNDRNIYEPVKSVEELSETVELRSW